MTSAVVWSTDLQQVVKQIKKSKEHHNISSISPKELHATLSVFKQKTDVNANNKDTVQGDWM